MAYMDHLLLHLYTKIHQQGEMKDYAKNHNEAAACSYLDMEEPNVDLCANSPCLVRHHVQDKEDCLPSRCQQFHGPSDLYSYFQLNESPKVLLVLNLYQKLMQDVLENSEDALGNSEDALGNCDLVASACQNSYPSQVWGNLQSSK